MAKKKYIESPEEMQGLFFNDFLKYLEKNPYQKKHWVGKDGDEVTEDIMRHPTWMGFEAYLARIDKIQKLTDYEVNKDGRYEEYATVISRIKAFCRGEVVTAALSNMAHPNLAARIHGINDKQEVEHSGQIETITGMRVIDNGTPDQGDSTTS